jgi:hypothetical protein
VGTDDNYRGRGVAAEEMEERGITPRRLTDAALPLEPTDDNYQGQNVAKEAL